MESIEDVQLETIAKSFVHGGIPNKISVTDYGNVRTHILEEKESNQLVSWQSRNKITGPQEHNNK